MSQEKYEKVWECKNCNIEFIPNPPNFNCPNCGQLHSTVPKREKREGEQLLQVPALKPFERVCHFQKNEGGVFCTLTGLERGGGGPLMMHGDLWYEPCEPSTCPIYQTW
jgi:hypothetical protein